MEPIEWRMHTAGFKGLAIVLWLGAVYFIAVGVVGTILESLWAGVWCGAFAAACAFGAVGVWRAKSDPPLILRLDDKGLTLFPLPGDRIFARFMPSRVGSLRWIDVIEVRTKMLRHGMVLEFIRRDKSATLLAQPGWAGISPHRLLMESRRRAEAAGARVRWPPAESLEPRLRAYYRPERRRRGGFPRAELRQAGSGTIQLGSSRRDVLLLCVIAVAAFAVLATLSIFNEMAPFTPRAAFLSWVVSSCLAIAALIALFWPPAVRVSAAGLEVRGRPRGPTPWRELREVRWSEPQHVLSLVHVDGRIRTCDLSPFAGPEARTGVREILRVSEANGVRTEFVDEAS